jgi:hypothetical protein
LTALCAIVLSLMALFVATRVAGRLGRASQRSAAVLARGTPLKMGPLVAHLLPLSTEDVTWIHRQIQPPDDIHELNPSYCLHILRAHGLNAHFTSRTIPTSAALLQPLLDSEVGERVFGHASLVHLPTGVRYPTGGAEPVPRWREHHRDQNLAALAELGLPLSISLDVENKAFLLRDVLKDSIANFHLQQKELEWTGLAYALYLPPLTGWANKYGERYTFDDLVGELLARRLSGASCGGAHLLYTLTMIWRADQETELLSESVRRLVRERLERYTQLVVSAQHPEGWWSADWFSGSEFEVRSDEPSPPPTTPQQRLIITGHLAEWMLYNPINFRERDELLVGASRWLLAYLKDLGRPPVSVQVCPCTHAICVLRQLAFEDISHS